MEKKFSSPNKKWESMGDHSSPPNTGKFPYTSCSPIPLAMAYVPVQTWEDIYDCDTALLRGTLFAQLDKPFIGEEAVPK